MNLPEIGQALKGQRIEQGLTQLDISDKIGYSVSSIRNMEHGKGGVLFTRYMEYAFALGLQINFVLEDEK